MSFSSDTFYNFFFHSVLSQIAKLFQFFYPLKLFSLSSLHFSFQFLSKKQAFFSSSSFVFLESFLGLHVSQILLTPLRGFAIHFYKIYLLTNVSRFCWSHSFLSIFSIMLWVLLQNNKYIRERWKMI